MKFFSWMQNKLSGGEGNSRSNRNSRPSLVPVTSNITAEPAKEEFSDWPQGLLTIGTFGNTDLTENNQEIQVEQTLETEIPQDKECLSPDFSEFTAEEIVKLKKELKKLLTRKSAASKATTEEQQATDLPLDRFLNCPSSLEVDRTISNRFSIASDDKDEDEIDRTIRIILERCKDVCEKKKEKGIGKKSISFLFKKMFVCSSGFAPTPNLRDSLPESRMEKLLRTMLSKKMQPQGTSRASSMKKYILDNKIKSKVEKEDESCDQTSYGGSSRWDKTDSEFIVLEI